MKKLSGFAVACAALVLSVTGANAQKAAQKLDNDFLIQAAVCENAEIEFSKLAASRANAKAVKDFAEKMVKDHQASYDKLAALLKDRKVGVVAGTEKETRDTISKLKELEGAAFDRAYLKQFIDDHKKAISMCEAQMEKGTQNDIKAFAKDCLPHIRDHLKMAEDLAKTVNR
jgi:putative membrane protein